MGFKIEKQAEAPKEYCDYVQQKIDIAKENGAVYELVDEDYRVQALYEIENLKTKEIIKVINRIRSNDDGKEYLVVNKNVDFFTPSGVYHDRFSTREGIIELPLKTTNPDTGATEVKQNKIVYTIPFSGSKVDQYLKTAEGQGSIPQLVFSEGSTTSNRLPINLPAVANPDFFKEASWTELQVGREKKLLNSLLNRLPEVKKELKGSSLEQKKEEEEVKKESTKQQEQVNKSENSKEDDSNSVIEVKSSSATGTTTGNTGISGGSKTAFHPVKKS